MAGGLLIPVRQGAGVQYRPPGWKAGGRVGAIEVPAGLSLVVVEGVGAGRRELAHLLDAVVWVQSDFAEAERRGIARDVASGVNGDPDAATESGTAGWPKRSPSSSSSERGSARRLSWPARPC